MNSSMNRRELLTYIVSFFMLVLMVAMVGYMTYIPIPQANEKPIMLILGALITGCVGAMSHLFGDRSDETEKLNERVKSPEANVAILEAKNNTLKREYDRLTAMLVERIDIGALAPK